MDHPFVWYLLYCFVQALWACRRDYQREGLQGVGPVRTPVVLCVYAALAPAITLYLISQGLSGFLQFLVTFGNDKK